MTLIDYLFYKFDQRQLRKKYHNPKHRKLYCVFLWAKFGVLETVWAGKFDDKGHPLTIQYIDHNGEYEHYYIAPWYRESTGTPMAYSFNKDMAENLAKRFNEENGNEDD